MRLFSEVVEPDGTACVWADDPKSDEVIRRCRERGLRLLTVGRKGETLKLVDRQASQLGQKLTIEAEGKAHGVNITMIGAHQAANVLTAPGRVIATGGHVRRTLANLSLDTPVRGRPERAERT